MNDPQFFWFTAAFTHNGHVCATEKEWVHFGASQEEWKRQNERAIRFNLPRPEKPLTRPEVTIGGSAQKFPAILILQDETKSFMIREDVAEDIKAAGITGFELDSVHVRKATPKSLRDLPIPKYYALVGLGTMDYSLRIYEHFRTSNSDRVEFRTTARNHTDPKLEDIRKGYGRYEWEIVPDQSTWDGSDIFRLINYRHGIYPLACSRRFLNLVRERDWDNFAFMPINDFGFSQIDFRKRSWPPSKWYSRIHPDYFNPDTKPVG